MLNRRTLLRFLGLGSAAAPAATASAMRMPQQLEVLDTYIAGYGYYQNLDLLSQMALGDSLQLQREPDNRHDTSAIIVYWHDRKIGYVPRVNNLALSRLMDQHRRVIASIRWLDSDSWQPVGFVVSVEV